MPDGISRAFKRLKPIKIDVPKRGRFVHYRIKPPKMFHKGSFRIIPFGKRGTKGIIACPKTMRYIGKRCIDGMRTQSVLVPKLRALAKRGLIAPLRRVANNPSYLLDREGRVANRFTRFSKAIQEFRRKAGKPYARIVIRPDKLPIDPFYKQVVANPSKKIIALKRRAFFVLPTVMSPDGQYIALVAFEGERGYNKTDWTWGKNLAHAEATADAMNKRMGLSKEQAMRIQLSTMRFGNNPPKRILCKKNPLLMVLANKSKRRVVKPKPIDRCSVCGAKNPQYITDSGIFLCIKHCKSLPPVRANPKTKDVEVSRYCPKCDRERIVKQSAKRCPRGHSFISKQKKILEHLYNKPKKGSYLMPSGHQIWTTKSKAKLIAKSGFFGKGKARTPAGKFVKNPLLQVIANKSLTPCPFKEKNIPIGKFEKWLYSTKNKEQISRYKEAMSKYKKFHLGANPTTISRQMLNVGGKQVTDRDFLYSAGKTPADIYEVPKTSNKYDEGKGYIHEWENAPETLVARDGKTIIKPLKGKAKITDWMRG